MPTEEGDDGAGQVGHHVVGVVGVECDPGSREGVGLSMHPLYHTAAATSTPPPQSCPCGECSVRWELSTPGEAIFPVNAELAVGRVFGRLRGWEGEGTFLCHNQESVLGYGGGGGEGGRRSVWVSGGGKRYRYIEQYLEFSLAFYALSFTTYHYCQPYRCFLHHLPVSLFFT